MKAIIFIVLFVFVIPVCFLAYSKKKDEKKKATQQTVSKEKQQPDRVKAVIDEQKSERAKMEAERAEWEAHHVRFLTNIVGVTYDNEDGTSRQKILKDYYVSGVAGSQLNLEEFEYKNEPAVRVLLDGQCVGNIPKNRVAELLTIMDRLERADIDIEVFTPDPDEDDPDERKRRGGTIYRADLSLIYTK